MIGEQPQFGQRLQEVRKAAGLTQRALAERLGVASVTVSYWEQGRNTPRPGAAERAIAECLGAARGRRSRHFAEALSSIPSPPCERYRCPHVRRCTDEQLACPAFHAYVTRGKVLEPWHDLNPHGRVRCGPRSATPQQPQPTRALFLRCYPENDPEDGGW